MELLFLAVKVVLISSMVVSLIGAVGWLDFLQKKVLKIVKLVAILVPMFACMFLVVFVFIYSLM